MAIIHLTSEEFADRMEEMFDLADKGDKVFIHYKGKLFTIVPISDEILEGLSEDEKELLRKAYNEPNEETKAAIEETRKGKFAGTIDTSSMEAFIKLNPE